MAKNVSNDQNVNELMFDGVVIEEEIEGVGEGRTIVPPSPTASGEHGGRLAAAACMRFPGKGDVEHIVCGGMHMFLTTAICSTGGCR